MSSPERALWLSVIGQALNDATYGLCKPATEQENDEKARKYCPSREAKLHAHLAKDFILGKTPSLKNICELIGDDYDYWKKKLEFAYNRCLPDIEKIWSLPPRPVKKNNKITQTPY